MKESVSRAEASIQWLALVLTLFAVAFPSASVAALVSTDVYVVEKPAALLVLIPGINESGGSMLTEEWKRFADEHHAALLAPIFHSNPKDVVRGKGYYYPEQGSGKELEEAIGKLERETGVKFGKIYLFGFSAGAHFAHRFALWRPDRAAAFVAYSAAWWSEPKASLRAVPALIMCGEDDPRFEATRAFFRKGQALGCPWVWRAWLRTGHEMTESVEKMAMAFLGHYLGGGSDAERLIGDAQTYRTYPMDELDEVPVLERVLLPSKYVAEVWREE